MRVLHVGSHNQFFLQNDSPVRFGTKVSVFRCELLMNSIENLVQASVLHVTIWDVFGNQSLEIPQILLQKYIGWLVKNIVDNNF